MLQLPSQWGTQFDRIIHPVSIFLERACKIDTLSITERLITALNEWSSSYKTLITCKSTHVEERQGDKLPPPPAELWTGLQGHQTHTLDARMFTVSRSLQRYNDGAVPRNLHATHLAVP